MTPQEFYENHFQKPMKEMALKIDKFSSFEMWEFAQAYADHLEAAQWVTDGSLPPVDEEDSEFSLNVLAKYDFDNDVVAYVNLRRKTWYNANSHDQIAEPKAWRPLPSPPNTKK